MLIPIIPVRHLCGMKPVSMSNAKRETPKGRQCQSQSVSSVKSSPERACNVRFFAILNYRAPIEGCNVYIVQLSFFHNAPIVPYIHIRPISFIARGLQVWSFDILRPLVSLFSFISFFITWIVGLETFLALMAASSLMQFRRVELRLPPAPRALPTGRRASELANSG